MQTFMATYSTAKTIEELQDQIRKKQVDLTDLKNFIDINFVWEMKKTIKFMTDIFHINDYTNSKQGVFNLFIQIMSVYDKNCKFDVLPDIDLRDPEQEIQLSQQTDSITNASLRNNVQNAIATHNWIEEEYEKLTPEERELYSSQDVSLEELMSDDVKQEDANDDFIDQISKEIEEEVIRLQEYENIRKKYIDIILTERNLDRDYLINEETGQPVYYSFSPKVRQQKYRSIAFKELEYDEDITDIDDVKTKIVSDFSNKQSLSIADILTQMTYDERDFNTL